MKRKNWHPPHTLIGPHWELQLLHVAGHWATYTEHVDQASANAMAERLRMATKNYRVIEVS